MFPVFFLKDLSTKFLDEYCSDHMHLFGLDSADISTGPASFKITDFNTFQQPMAEF
jgi:hypothetical protein